jgi:hypothetical protein
LVAEGCLNARRKCPWIEFVQDVAIPLEHAGRLPGHAKDLIAIA